MDPLCTGTGNKTTKSIFPLSRHRFNTIPTQISPKRFIDIHEAILKCVWKGKGTRRVKTVLKIRKSEREDSVYPIS